MIHVGPGGLGDLPSEVIVSVAESKGPVVVCPSAMDPVLGVLDSTLTSLWLSAT